MEQLAELFNVNHFLVSQCNPQASFLSTFGRDSHSSFLPVAILSKLLNFFKNQLRTWLKNFFRSIAVTTRTGAPW